MGACGSTEDTTAPKNTQAKKSGQIPPVPVWASNTGQTHTDIARQRQIFWETQPAYGGNKEVWDLLKAMMPLRADFDREHWESMLLAAEVTIANNSWDEIYDSMGVRYEVPRYAIADPIDLTE